MVCVCVSLYIYIYIYIKNRMKKGQTMKNMSNFKLDCPNKLQIFSSTFTNCCFKG